MPYCIVLDIREGKVKIIPYPKGDDRNIEDELIKRNIDISEAQWMCVDQVIIETEE